MSGKAPYHRRKTAQLHEPHSRIAVGLRVSLPLRIRLLLLHFQSKELFDVLREVVINLIVARHGLLLASRRIAVDVMTRPVAHQHTARPFELPDQLAALHKAISFIW